jgi:hypothetical protein
MFKKFRQFISLFAVLLIFVSYSSTLQAQQQTQTSQSGADNAKPKGKITIKTSEPGAQIIILNRYNMVEVKKTQVKDSEVYRLKEGMYRVEVNKQNYLSQTRDLYVRSGMDEVMFFDMQPYIMEKKGIFGAAYNGGPKKTKSGYTKYFIGLGVAAVVLGAAAILLGGSQSNSTLPSPPARP